MTIADITGAGRSGGTDPLYSVSGTDHDRMPEPLHFRARWSRPSPLEALAAEVVVGCVSALGGVWRSAWWVGPPVVVALLGGLLAWARTRASSPAAPPGAAGYPRWRNPVDLLVPAFETGQVASRGGDTIGLACDGSRWIFGLSVSPPPGSDPTWVLGVLRAVDLVSPTISRVQVVLPLRSLPDDLLRSPTTDWSKAAESLASADQVNPGLVYLSLPQRGSFGHLTVDSAIWLRSEIRQAMTPLRSALGNVGLTTAILDERQLRTSVHRLSFGPEVRTLDDAEPGRDDGGSTWRYVDRNHVVFEVVAADEAQMAELLRLAGQLRLPGLVVGFGRVTCSGFDELPPRGVIDTALVGVTHLSDTAAERAAERVEAALDDASVVFRRLDRQHRAGLTALLPIGPDLPRRTRFVPRHRPGGSGRQAGSG